MMHPGDGSSITLYPRRIAIKILMSVASAVPRHRRNISPILRDMTDHDHDHHHHDHDHSELSETELRVRALETVLTEKGYVEPAALDLLIETYEKKVGPRNGARVVAKAWADPAYRARLIK